MRPLELTNIIEFPRAVRPPGLSRKRRRHVIAIGGGKGGIGKTLVSVNLGIALSRRGHQVVIVDADLGGANVHTCFGLSQPTLTLSDFIARRVGRLEEVMVPSGIENVRLIAGAQDLLEAANPKYQQKVKLLRHLQSLDVDYVLLDLGAGTTFNVLDFFLIADHGVVVLLPEPTSVENAYRFIKAAFFRRLQEVEARYGIADVVATAAVAHGGTIRTPFDILAEVRARDVALADRFEAELTRFEARLIVNQARTSADQGIGNAVVSAWKKFFGLEMNYLGAIPYDDEAWRAVRRRRPVLIERPNSEAAAGLLRVAENLLALDSRSNSPDKS